ncbi:MAG: alpha/beta fold hydrolase [Ornithinibacter sp.]
MEESTTDHGGQRQSPSAPDAGPAPVAHPGLAEALLDPEGGAGAELRGHVPDDPRGVVLILHGGAEDSRMPVRWWSLAALRMLPFATAISRRAGHDLAVVRLKYRVRGWNGIRQDPVQDARWALERIRRVLPGLPIALIGHSMGGRVALHLANQPDVAAIAALAPWIVGDVTSPRPGTRMLLMHGTRDRMTDPRRTQVIAERYTLEGADVTHVPVDGETHAMLHHPGRWHDDVATFVTDALAGSDPLQ